MLLVMAPDIGVVLAFWMDTDVGMVLRSLLALCSHPGCMDSFMIPTFPVRGAEVKKKKKKLTSLQLVGSV